MNKLPYGLWTAGNGVYGKCTQCGDIVKLNKFLLGSFHFCTSDEPFETEPKKGLFDISDLFG